MAGNQIQQQVVQILKKNGYEVKPNYSYKGVQLDVYAENKDSSKRVFMYVLEAGIASAAHAINLDQIQVYRKKQKLGKGCSYVIISPKGATITATRIARSNKIPIYKKLEKFTSQALV